MQKVAEKVLSEHYFVACRLIEAQETFNNKGLWELAHACKQELELLYGYKREYDQLELLKENLRSRGLTEIVIKIEEVHIHG